MLAINDDVYDHFDHWIIIGSSSLFFWISFFTFLFFLKMMSLLISSSLDWNFFSFFFSNNIFKTRSIRIHLVSKLLLKESDSLIQCCSMFVLRKKNEEESLQMHILPLCSIFITSSSSFVSIRWKYEMNRPPSHCLFD